MVFRLVGNRAIVVKKNIQGATNTQPGGGLGVVLAGRLAQRDACGLCLERPRDREETRQGEGLTQPARLAAAACNTSRKHDIHYLPKSRVQLFSGSLNLATKLDVRRPRRAVI